MRLSVRLLLTSMLIISSDYFTKILEDDLKAVVKPQYVDQIPKAVKGPNRTVGALLKSRSQNDNLDEMVDLMGMEAQRPELIYILICLFRASQRHGS